MKATAYRDAIDELIATDGPCVSITIPTYRTGADRLEAPIRLKNRLAEAEKLLSAEGMRPTEARDLLEKAYGLVEDTSFWLHQGDGLALYVAPHFMRYFWLPMEVPELTTVGDTFQVRALIPMLEVHPYYVLKIDPQGPQLYRVQGRNIVDIHVPDMPESLDAVVGIDYSEKQRQMHSAGPVGQAGSTISHGSGDRAADDKNRLLRFCERVDRAICQTLSDVVSPIVLVGDEPTTSIYRNCSHYPNIHAQTVREDLKTATRESLLEKTRAVMEPIASRREDAERKRFAKMAGTGLTSDDLGTLVRESEHGRIDVLFVNRELHKWDPNAPKGHKQDLINRLEVETLRNSGKVYELEPEEMPAPTAAAGIYRY